MFKESTLFLDTCSPFTAEKSSSNSSNHKSMPKRHLHPQTVQKPFVCTVCKQGFCDNEHLQQHLRLHPVDLSCHICKKRFRLKVYLDTHLRFVHGQHLYASDAEVHKRVNEHLNNYKRNNSEENFSCNKCNIAFSTIWHLKRHLHIHYTKKSFKCDICKISFLRKDNLERHQLIHTRERSFLCGICKKALARKDHLYRHLRNVHEQNLFVCLFCNKSFKKWTNLFLHFRVHRNEKLS